MVDLSEFEALSSKHPNRCVVVRSAERLGDGDREKLEAALAAAHIGHSTISRWLKQRGVAGNEQAVRKHRNGDCCCA